MFIAPSIASPRRSALRGARGQTVASKTEARDVDPLDVLVPGDYPQTEQELAYFPRPVLRLLADSGVRVAILQDGKTLADSPALRTLETCEYAAERKVVNTQVSEVLGQVFEKGVDSLDAVGVGNRKADS